MTRVQDVLRNRTPYYVQENQTVAEVVRRMAELNVGAILVLQEGQLRGVFSERDLMTKVVLAGTDPTVTPVSEVMSKDLATVEETATVEEAMERMQRHSCRHLPVMRGDEVAGFLSMRDLMKLQLAEKTEEIHHMRAYIRSS